MGRAILAVVVGYLVMGGVVFLGLSGAYLGMGTERALRPASFQVSTLWLVVYLVVSILAAVAGGYFCAAIARRPTPPKVLAGLVLVFGLLMAVPVLMDTNDPGPRAGSLGNMDAMMQAKQPGWAALLNPLIGAAGVMIGAGMRQNAKQGA